MAWLTLLGGVSLAARIKPQCCRGPCKMRCFADQGTEQVRLKGRWAMMELILTVCALSAPSQAPPYIAQWSNEHPGKRVTQWRCAYPGDEKI